MEEQPFYDFLNQQDVDGLKKIIKRIVLLIKQKEEQIFLETIKEQETIR